MYSRASFLSGPRSRGPRAHSSPRCIAILRFSRSRLTSDLARAFSSGVRGFVGAPVPVRPEVVPPWMERYLLRSDSLRLGVGRRLAACAAGLVLAGASGLCSASGLSALLAVASALLRRNTEIA